MEKTMHFIRGLDVKCLDVEEMEFENESDWTDADRLIAFKNKKDAELAHAEIVEILEKYSILNEGEK